MRFAPGGIRKGAAGFDITFLHPKGNEESPIGGEGVLIELVLGTAGGGFGVRQAGRRLICSAGGGYCG